MCWHDAASSLHRAARVQSTASRLRGNLRKKHSLQRAWAVFFTAGKCSDLARQRKRQRRCLARPKMNKIIKRADFERKPSSASVGCTLISHTDHMLLSICKLAHGGVLQVGTYDLQCKRLHSSQCYCCTGSSRVRCCCWHAQIQKMPHPSVWTLLYLLEAKMSVIGGVFGGTRF